MTRNIPAAIAGVLLGLLFVMAAVTVLFHLKEMPPPPAGTPAAAFFAAFGPTGYFTFIKVLELIGGVLVAIPATRRLGLLVLGPIIVNIIAFVICIGGGIKDLANPMMIAVIVLPLYLVWAERRAFAAFVRGDARG